MCGQLCDLDSNRLHGNVLATYLLVLSSDLPPQEQHESDAFHKISMSLENIVARQNLSHDA